MPNDNRAPFRKARKGCSCQKKKTPRAEGQHKVQGSVDPMFAAGLHFLVPEFLEFKAFLDSGKISSNFPGIFLQNSRTDPRIGHTPTGVLSKRRTSAF